MPDDPAITATRDTSPGSPPAPPAPEIAERGRGDARSDTRLFMQLLAFTGCRDTDHVVAHARSAHTPAVVYEDLLDPHGVALLTFSTDPADFVTHTRRLVQRGPLAEVTPRPEMTMFGRTYSLGYEPDLTDALIDRPTRTALNPEWPWAVWYPLRRGGAFEQLPRDRQMDILKEHGTIGMAFGRNDLAHDIRLACHGLSTDDNDFVIGLVGKDLTPLSKLVQTMRSTTQTAQYLEHLGPFFVGRTVYQSASD